MRALFTRPVIIAIAATLLVEQATVWNTYEVLWAIAGSLGCAYIAKKRNRSEWFALWGFAGGIGWAGVALFLGTAKPTPPPASSAGG